MIRYRFDALRFALATCLFAFSSAACDTLRAQPAAKPAEKTESSQAKANIEAGSLHALGKASLGKGDVQKAIELYTKAIRLNPQFSLAWLDRGYAHMVGGKVQLAVADYDKGIEWLPATETPGPIVDALVSRATAYIRLGKLPAAMADLDRAATIWPRSGKVFARRAYAHMIAKAHGPALADAVSAIAFDGYSQSTVLARAVRATIMAARQNFDDGASDLRWMSANALDALSSIQALRAVFTLGHPSDAKMTMRVVRLADGACEPTCPEWIALQGRIVSGQQDDFTKLVDRLGDKKKLPVLIDSNGGSVEAAMAIGRLIRQRELDVIVARTEMAPACGDDVACKTRLKGDRTLGTPSNVAARCSSSCVYILAAGNQRIVGALTGVGVHQITFYQKYSSPPDAERLADDRRKGRIVVTSADGPRLLGATSDEIYLKTLRYYRDMNIDESIMEYLLAAPPQGMSWLTMRDLVSIGLVTGSGFVEQYFNGKVPPPPVVTLPSPVKIEPAATTAELVRDLNRELVRLGCLPLPKDMTSWSAASKTALTRYSALMGRSTSAMAPSQTDLDRLRRHNRPVCPSACPAGANEQDKLCVLNDPKKS